MPALWEIGQRTLQVKREAVSVPGGVEPGDRGSQPSLVWVTLGK